ncbi:hypothetical protein [Rhizorhabdus wittichii]|uniref:hypothetical protein n=1 Tax=Rhizorhabdus wittichii TaxID=160791 RepID=UPI000382487E|nr:hypothetical protein [Rhizorhabdus wittichii]
MTDTLTACARAMYEAHPIFSPMSGDQWDWDWMIKEGWELPEMHLKLARACLTALAENVSEEMVEAGINESSFHGIDPLAVSAEVVGTFTAMVRAAISERA